MQKSGEKSRKFEKNQEKNEKSADKWTKIDKICQCFSPGKGGNLNAGR